MRLSWWLSGKKFACSEGATGDMGWGDPVEEGMATHSSILAWKIPWTEEPVYGLWDHKSEIRLSY